MTDVEVAKSNTIPLTDRLGDEFMASFSAATRRATGSTYTPLGIVTSMVDDAANACDPDCIVDCGCGSGRFAVAAALAFPTAKVYAVDNFPLACAMCAENARAYGLADRIEVVCASFLDFTLPSCEGPCLWIGNPPYVRHHDIDPSDKLRLKETASGLGLPSSALAGLHIHFMAHIAELWRPGDFGMLITSAEWMDVNYGAFARALLTGMLPMKHMRLFDRGTRMFEGTNTTAAVFSFSDAPAAKVRLTLPDGDVREVPISVLKASQKWTRTIECLHATPGGDIADMVPLGEIASVHRGVVTGANNFWVRPAAELEWLPDELKTPIVSHAREIMDGGLANGGPELLNRLIALPRDLGGLKGRKLKAARRIIAEGEALGIDKGHVASSRASWWSVRPPKPPAIMMTYMSRKAPTFIRNKYDLPMLNVVHGIYPKVDMSGHALDKLVDYLNGNVRVSDGRIYCGGLAKFEPKEAEAILVPPLEKLEV